MPGQEGPSFQQRMDVRPVESPQQPGSTPDWPRGLARGGPVVKLYPNVRLEPFELVDQPDWWAKTVGGGLDGREVHSDLEGCSRCQP